MAGKNSEAKPDTATGSSRNLNSLMRMRKRCKEAKPEFLRQEHFRFSSLGRKWRAPKGNQSKLRRHFKSKGWMPSPGYGSPAAVRGLHPSGAKERLIHNVAELSLLNPRSEAARIARTVGTRRRTELLKAAEERGIKILNPNVRRRPTAAAATQKPAAVMTAAPVAAPEAGAASDAERDKKVKSEK